MCKSHRKKTIKKKPIRPSLNLTKPKTKLLISQLNFSQQIKPINIIIASVL